MPSRPAPPLSGWYAISLRPQNQHAGMRRAAAALGARCFALSTLRLAASDDRDALREALGCDRILATSPAAVRFADAALPLLSAAGKQWFAIGGGTASALRRCGVANVHLPEGRADSEALLAHSALQRLRGQRVGLVTAPGGRGLLEKALRERGARPCLAHVYRRESCRIGDARRAALAALPARSALLVSSGEALQSLWQQLDAPGRKDLQRRLAVASSPRLAGLLREHGFARVLVAADARPASLLSALARHVAAGRFR